MRKKTLAQPTMSKQNKSVHITQADNGFSVSSYGDHGETVKVAKSHHEAFRHAKGMLGVKSPIKKKKG